jgi:glycosyltransferase involved in cell wall biosynthesis
MSETPFVSVYAMTYNQRDKVTALVQDLTVQDYPADRFEFIALVDGSTDGTADALDELVKQVPYRLVVLRRDHEGDYLCSLRRNECNAAADPEATVFVHVDDVRVRPDFVRLHAQHHAAQELRVVSGAQSTGAELNWAFEKCLRRHLAGPDGQARTTHHWMAMWGCSFSYPRRLAEMLHDGEFDRPFDERMTDWGGHESEFACRAHLAGAELIYDPAVGVFHQDHTKAEDAARGLDYEERKRVGSEKNMAYIRRKHGLTEIPRW